MVLARSSSSMLVRRSISFSALATAAVAASIPDRAALRPEVAELTPASAAAVARMLKAGAPLLC